MIIKVIHSQWRARLQLRTAVANKHNLIPNRCFLKITVIKQDTCVLNFCADRPTPNKWLSAALGPCGPSSGSALGALLGTFFAKRLTFIYDTKS